MTDQSNTREQFTQKREPATIHEEGLPVETISFAQFMRAIVEQEAEGVETGEIAYPVKNVEPIPGTELHKKRVCVSFDFDVVCNSEAILNSGNDGDIQAHDLALLRSFLQSPQLIDMLVDKIGSELGFNSPESFIQRFLPQINTECHSLFSKAIESLSGKNGEYWRDIRDAPNVGYEAMLSICTEQIFECFSAKFVNSSYEIVDTLRSVNLQDR